MVASPLAESLAAVVDQAPRRRPGPPLLVARLRAAGLDDEPFLAAAPQRDAAIAPADPVPAARAGLRRIDLKRLLEEDL